MSATSSKQVVCMSCRKTQTLRRGVMGFPDVCPSCNDSLIAAMPSPAVKTFQRPQPTVGYGCARCGSQNWKTKRNVKSVGWGLIIAGLFLTIFTLGLSIVLVIVGACMEETVTHCKRCGYFWHN